MAEPATEAAPAAAAQEAEVASMFDLSTKKKKKSKKVKKSSSSGSSSSRRAAAAAEAAAAQAPAAEAAAAAGEGDAAPAEAAGGNQAGEQSPAVPAPVAEDPATYTYDDLLDRIVDTLRDRNPDLSERKRHVMQPPQLCRIGTKKTLWSNFPQIVGLLHRAPEHVTAFVFAELGTDGSIDGSGRLVLKGKFVPKYIEAVLRKYINEYVTCRGCRSPSTTLTKDAVSRLSFLHCGACGSTRSVAAIRSGFHAQTRADRRAARK